MTPEPQQEMCACDCKMNIKGTCTAFCQNRLPLTKAPSPITTVNDMERGKSRLVPDGSTSAPGREESRHVGGNCDGYDGSISETPDASPYGCGITKAVCEAHDAKVAHAATLATLDLIIKAFEKEDDDGFANMTRAKRIVETFRTQEAPE
jgi:hypothetical protein